MAEAGVAEGGVEEADAGLPAVISLLPRRLLHMDEVAVVEALPDQPLTRRLRWVCDRLFRSHILL